MHAHSASSTARTDRECRLWSQQCIARGLGEVCIKRCCIASQNSIFWHRTGSLAFSRVRASLREQRSLRGYDSWEERKQ
jgi:hypothetical protein